MCSHARDIGIFILGIFLQATEYNANTSLDIWNQWKKWSRTLATSPVGPRYHPPPYPSLHQWVHHKIPCMANGPWLPCLDWEHSDLRWWNETFERNDFRSWCAHRYETMNWTYNGCRICNRIYTDCLNTVKSHITFSSWATTCRWMGGTWANENMQKWLELK